MAQRNDRETLPQPVVSSIVVMGPSGSGVGSDEGGGGGRKDFELHEDRGDVSPYYRRERGFDDRGYRARGPSSSPRHRIDTDRPFAPDNSYPDTRLSHGFVSGRHSVRSPGRYRRYSPPHFRKNTSNRRSFGRASDGVASGRGEGLRKNNPNVRPREGDWYCQDPVCGNLNFARREYCNNCRLPRHGPKRSYVGHSPEALPSIGGTFHRQHLDPSRSPGQFRGSHYRPSPPHAVPRGPPPRNVGIHRPPSPPTRYRDRVPPPTHLHYPPKDRLDFQEDGYRDRANLAGGRLQPLDWTSVSPRGIDNVSRYNDRRLPSPLPVAPQNGRWEMRQVRERSPSPLRSGRERSLSPLRSGRERSLSPLRSGRERSRTPLRGGPPAAPARRDFHRGSRSRTPLRGGPPAAPARNFHRGSRSRTPLRGGPPAAPARRDFHRGSYPDSGRDDGRRSGRGRIGRVF